MKQRAEPVARGVPLATAVALLRPRLRRRLLRPMLLRVAQRLQPTKLELIHEHDECIDP